METQENNRKIINTREAAEYLGLTESTLEKWRCYGTGPRFCKVGRSVRYRMADIEKYLTENTKGNTSCVD
jgi:excisionase family DNA binding protein